MSVKDSNDVDYTDIGAINSDVTAVLQWDESQLETANAGKLAKHIKNMRIEGALTLINLTAAGITKMAGGIITQVDTAASENSAIPDQTIAAGWAARISYPLVMYTSSSDSTQLRMTTAPAFTSIVCNTTTPETLVDGTDYVIVADSNAVSGWSIQFIPANFTQADPTLSTITINYAANTPVGSTTLYAGSSTLTTTAYAMKMTHTDSASKVRELELFSVDPNAGGFAFNFKAASADGVEEMPLTFTAKLDTTLTDGRQLMSWKVEAGAA